MIVFGDHPRCGKFIDVPFVQGADGVEVLKPRRGINAQYADLLMRAVSLPDKGYSRHNKFLRASYFPICAEREQEHIVARVHRALSEIDDCLTEIGRILG